LFLTNNAAKINVKVDKLAIKRIIFVIVMIGKVPSKEDKIPPRPNPNKLL
jgi:hypothetical protein